jgi:hypothetical protein
MALDLTPPDGRKRVKVYELRDNDWFDRGTGFCSGHILEVSLSSSWKLDSSGRTVMACAWPRALDLGCSSRALRSCIRTRTSPRNSLNRVADSRVSFFLSAGGTPNIC